MRVVTVGLDVGPRADRVLGAYYGKLYREWKDELRVNYFRQQEAVKAKRDGAPWAGQTDVIPDLSSLPRTPIRGDPRRPADSAAAANPVGTFPTTINAAPE